jgi:hypothetical protein
MSDDEVWRFFGPMIGAVTEEYRSDGGRHMPSMEVASGALERVREAWSMLTAGAAPQ